MNVNETLSILQALKGIGATHFKSQDFEVTLDKMHTLAVGSQGKAIDQTSSPSTVPDPDAQANAAATEKLKGLISTLNMSNEQLADKIFPAGAGM